MTIRRHLPSLPVETTGVATWQDPQWRTDALDWAVDVLERRGCALTAPVEQPHVRPWSTAFRLPTDAGVFWLKSVGPGSAHEPPLAAALAEWVPGQVLTPVAVEPGRRLLLLPDGGPTLRETRMQGLSEAWEALLGNYARLQIALTTHAQELVELGVPDGRPDRMPDLAADLLADDEALLAGRPDGIDPEARERIVAALPDYADACRRLAEGPVPASLQHDDLHDANVFIDANSHRFFDWGDASVAHPFLSLLVPLGAAARAMGVPGGHPVLLRLRDAYLWPWREHADAATLRELCEVALSVGPLMRAVSWRRILDGVHPGERGEWAGSVPGWTAEVLEPGPLDPR
jgi:Phosphotransferase enzyme family